MALPWQGGRRRRGRGAAVSAALFACLAQLVSAQGPDGCAAAAGELGEGHCPAAVLEDGAEVDLDAEEGGDGPAVHLLQRRGEFVLRAARAAAAAKEAPHHAPAPNAMPCATSAGAGAGGIIADAGAMVAKGVGAGAKTARAAGGSRAPPASEAAAGVEAAASWSSVSQPVPDVCAPPPRSAVRFDALGAMAFSPARAGSPTLARAAAAYSAVLAVVPYGFLVLFLGSGSTQLLATVAYWIIARPAGAALEALWAYSAGCPGAPHNLAATHSTTAHFYWAWATLEIATRRRPLWQRLAAVALLSAILLPVPAAQVFLQDRTPMQASAGALLGNALGVGFFVGLRTTGMWANLLEWKPQLGGFAAFWLCPWDNLTTFWGGSMWPRSPGEFAFRSKAASAAMARQEWVMIRG